ncbi:HDOD domain-containing protein [Chitinibacter fontanus]|uniref:HDOD domain-containing protein n=1 Tax=Chitinibacter fontanus TaxID=1737446 RepID=A0A7D5ZB80_9NEIS|nr:serine/threonine protein kinase [Chitinibacter fontanus]QLI80304.1 HDOD domain-containing protein [Chitinibacter fontanus]
MKSFSNGRFLVEKKIGQGAQGLVYLARDTHLDRQVAIKVLHSQPLQALVEAQLISRIQHPNIVTLYDAFADQSHPCLVFEYVAGETLADLLRQQKTLAPVAAVQMMVAVLDGLQAAHLKGVIHRDMKPQNIMIDENARPRIMDFGVASQRGQSYEGLSGTAGFISPEMIKNLPVDAQADVFACGVMLYQMLTGRLVSDGDSVMAILYKTANEEFVPPSRFNDQIDERLDHLVMAALFKNPEARYADAGQMREALIAWLEAAGVTEQSDSNDGRHSTIDFLLRRMRHSADFPALSQTISAINKVDESQAEKVQSLSGVILQDFSLTNKLLKVVNSASYGQFGGAISTVSRAIVILGFDRIRALAVTILLFEHMQNKGHAARLRDVVLEIFFGGMLCRKLADKSGWRDVEEALICGMFQHLGRLLTHFYFNEESIEIIKRKSQTGESESIAAEAILGVSYADLGVAIAREWNFPDRIVTSMRPLPETRVREPVNQVERLRVFANLATDLLPLINMKPSEASVYTQGIMKRFSPIVSWSEREFHELMQDAAKQYLSYLSLLNIDLGYADFANNLRSLAGVKPPPEAKLVNNSTVDPQVGVGAAQTTITNPAAMLSAGVQDITNTLVGDFNLNDVLRMILETMFRSVGFDRVLFCTRDVKKGTMVARFGFGKELDAILPKFSFPITPLVDVFQLVLAKNADVFIEDVDAGSIAQRIPTWYRSIAQSKTLVIFPVVIDKKPIGLFYADRMEAHSLHLPHEQLNLLKTLRNQAILAIRQKQMGS